MTPMDIFDNMLESIQQFPMECSNFERHIKRLNKDQHKYSTRFDRLILKLISPDDTKFTKLCKKLRRIRKRKLELVESFQRAIGKQQQRLEELVRISNIDTQNFNFSPLEGTTCSVIKLSEIPQGNSKYCICNDKAYGLMICCENPGCPIKWHHFRCVDLLATPKVQWLCPKCSAAK